MTRPAAPRPVGGETGNSLWSAVGWQAGTRAGAGATALRGLAAVLLAAVTWGWLVEPRWLQARAFRLPLAGGPPQPLRAAATRRPGPGGLRLAHLTDLHAPVYRIPEAALLRQLQAWQPDAVVFTGDLAEGPHHPATRGVALMAELARRWPVFLVPGNHDHLYGWSRLRRDLEAAGVQVLVNRGTVLRAGEAAVYLAGVDDPHTGRDRVGEALAGAPPGTPVVLLAHAPAEGIRRSAAARGVRLVLAGHTHGGQVRLPLVGALWIPGQGWFPRYDRGWFDIGGTWWYIATGLGTPRPWIRFRCRPELVLIELVPPAPRTGPPAQGPGAAAPEPYAPSAGPRLA